MPSHDPAVMAGRAAFRAARRGPAPEVYDAAARYLQAVVKATGATYLLAEVSPNGLHALTDLAAYLVDADDDPAQLEIG